MLRQARIGERTEKSTAMSRRERLAEYLNSKRVELAHTRAASTQVKSTFRDKPVSKATLDRLSKPKNTVSHDERHYRSNMDSPVKSMSNSNLGSSRSNSIKQKNSPAKVQEKPVIPPQHPTEFKFVSSRVPSGNGNIAEKSRDFSSNELSRNLFTTNNNSYTNKQEITEKEARQVR